MAFRTLPRAPITSVATVLIATSLAGCGGGDKAADLEGTAAIGAPISAGTVIVKCATGTPLQTTTSASGVWSVAFSGQTLPCAVQVAGGSLPGSVTLHSVAVQPGVVNITPLTDLVVARLTGQNPGSWFASVSPTQLQAVTANAVGAAVDALKATLALGALNPVDPIRTAFQATRGNAMDDILEALADAMAAAQVTYQQLLEFARQGSQANPQQSQAFAALLAQKYNQLINPGSGGSGTSGSGSGNTGAGGGSTGSSGSGSGSGSGGLITGNYTLTLNVTAAGVTTVLSLQNMPKPSNQQEFCGEVSQQTSPISLNQALSGVNGTFTLNSCSFNGTVGQVSATLSMSVQSPMGPISTTVPYNVTYTYSQ